MVVYSGPDIVNLAQMTVLERTMSNPWIFDDERLHRTPSLRDGISKTEEFHLRIDGSKFIKVLGTEFGLNFDTVATGTVFFHRFYMFYSFKQFQVYPVAATCLFLAGKAEETPKKSSDIVKFAKLILKEDEYAQFGVDPKEEILTLERILLQTLRFDLQVEHPYGYLIKYVRSIMRYCKKTEQTLAADGVSIVEVSANVDSEQARRIIMQAAWTFTNDSCCTTVCLQYEPEIVALAMILLACKTDSLNVTSWEGRTTDQMNWWDVFVENLPETTLEAICHQVIDVYELLRKPEPTEESNSANVT